MITTVSNSSPQFLVDVKRLDKKELEVGWFGRLRRQCLRRPCAPAQRLSQSDDIYPRGVMRIRNNKKKTACHALQCSQMPRKSARRDGKGNNRGKKKSARRCKPIESQKEQELHNETSSLEPGGTRQTPDSALENRWKEKQIWPGKQEKGLGCGRFQHGRRRCSNRH